MRWHAPALALLAATCAAGAKARWVRVACTQGPDTLEKYGLPAFEKALDHAGRAGADLVLLPEYVSSEMVEEPSARLIAAKAREHRMLVAGTIARRDAPVRARALKGLSPIAPSPIAPIRPEVEH